jgi:hypothetical protein
MEKYFKTADKKRKFSQEHQSNPKQLKLDENSKKEKNKEHEETK